MAGKGLFFEQECKRLQLVMDNRAAETVHNKRKRNDRKENYYD